MKPLFRDLEDYLVTKQGCANNAIFQLCCDKVASVSGIFVFFSSPQCQRYVNDCNIEVKLRNSKILKGNQENSEPAQTYIFKCYFPAEQHHEKHFKEVLLSFSADLSS